MSYIIECQRKGKCCSLVTSPFVTPRDNAAISFDCSKRRTCGADGTDVVELLLHCGGVTTIRNGSPRKNIAINRDCSKSSSCGGD